LADLDIHFARLGLLVKAAEYALAYDVIEDIQPYLNKWNCGFLLLGYRERVRERLGDQFLEMANDNELGDLYGELGSFAQGSEAYGRALDYANKLGRADIRTRLQANLGAMYWQHNDAARAYAYYDLAREEAEHGDLVVLMGALEGLADCHRRWGQYELALSRAAEALAVPDRPDYVEGGGLGTAGSVRMVRIALRLARWYNELDRTTEAVASLDAAERIAAARQDSWLRAACLDGRADLLLSQSAVGEAIARATDALELATELHDPVIILQARTTLCTAALMDGDMRKAADHIENADRYRRAGRALIVLALQALVTLQTNPAKAADLFDKLAEQARTRIGTDGRDVGAYDMLGFAICGQLLNTEESLADAVGAFQSARDVSTSSTPGLLARRIFLVRQLDRCARRPGRLGPVLDVLASAGSSPMG
jgi:tetratricopeptide (TPR) repeat protein